MNVIVFNELLNRDVIQNSMTHLGVTNPVDIFYWSRNNAIIKSESKVTKTIKQAIQLVTAFERWPNYTFVSINDPIKPPSLLILKENAYLGSVNPDILLNPNKLTELSELAHDFEQTALLKIGIQYPAMYGPALDNINTKSLKERFAIPNMKELDKAINDIALQLHHSDILVDKPRKDR